jgi:hypothetical protein
MASKEEAQAALNKILQNKKDKFDFRFAVTGDGNGTAASNFYISQDKSFCWVRDINNLDRPYAVLHRGKISPKVNLPVIVGRDDIEPQFEKILGLNYDGLPRNISASIAQDIGQHHTQHEWGGGDEVFLDGRQLTPGLVYPTSPASMQVRIKPFVYFWNGWGRYTGGTSVDLTTYKPSNAGFAVALLIVFDRENEIIDYVQGSESTLGSSWYSITPDPRPRDMPLGIIGLENSTTEITWTNSTDNLLDARRHVDSPENATQIGQMYFSHNGKSFDVGVPVTEPEVGLLYDEQSGYIIFS